MDNEITNTDERIVKKKKTFDKEKAKEILKKTGKVVAVIAGVALAVGATIGICKVVNEHSSSNECGVGCSGGLLDDDDEYISSSRNKSDLDHHANQMNPNNQAYQDRMDNHANQLNPNNWRFGGGNK